MLRTRIADGAEQSARTLVLPLTGGICLAAGAAVTGALLLTAAALAVTLVAGVLLARPHAGTASRGMQNPAGAPVLAGLTWFAGSLLTLSVLVATAGSWAVAAERLAWLTPALLVGFAAQVLAGALTFLLPVVLGGGPNAVRTTSGVLARGWTLRLVVANVGLLVCLLPVPSMVRVAVSVLVLAAAVAVLPLAVRAVVVARRLRRQSAGDDTGSARDLLGMPSTARPAAQAATGGGRSAVGLAAAGLSAVVLASAVGVALDPASAGVSAAGVLNGWERTSQAVAVEPTGRTTTVQVRIEGMSFVPDVLDVPVGDRLVVVLENTGDDRHDLVLETGQRTPRLAPGRSSRLDAGVIGGAVEGWCSLPGHRSMGMTLTIRPIGVAGAPAAGEGSGDHAAHDAALTDLTDGASETISDAEVARALNRTPGAGVKAWPARLEPASSERVHRVRLEVTEHRQEVAPGITQTRWTFGGTAPGPALRGRVGDVFEITLVNDGSLGHSIDFHAGALAPQGPMRTIQPGESLVYRFTAIRAGVWMYHCSTMPMSMHIANGMFGAVIIDPPDLEPVDAEYVLVQSEVYLGAHGGTADAEAISAEKPDLVVFNGYARQYDHKPLPAKVGERVRLWVLAAGPQRGSAFHVVGGQFDTVWTEGAYTLRPGRTAADASGASGGAQVLPLVPAQGGFVELSFPEVGTYPFVTHAMVDAERGAHGVVEVTAVP
jgi:nitrite reductase (NO-forming)